MNMKLVFKKLNAEIRFFGNSAGLHVRLFDTGARADAAKAR